MRSDFLPESCWRSMYKVMQRGNLNAIRVSLETGLRIDDVLCLKTSDLYADNGIDGNNKFEYVAKKTGKVGHTEISLELWRELRREAGEIWVFPGRNPEKHRTRQAVWKDVKKASKLLGFEGQISPHSARKTFAVELRKSKGLSEVQKALQHTDRETTMLYAFADVANRSEKEQAQNIEEFADVVVRKIEQLFDSRGIFQQKMPKK